MTDTQTGTTALAVVHCIHCHLALEAAAEMPNGSVWRHESTGWRRCTSDYKSTWAESKEGEIR